MIKDLLYFMLILLLILGLTIANAARADVSGPSCPEVLGLCDTALRKERKENQDLQALVQTQQQYIEGLNKEGKTNEGGLPGYAWVTIGIAAGITLKEIFK